MKTYKVQAQYVTYVYQFIEAENDEDAWEKAHELDGGSFKDSGYGDWDIYSVELEETSCKYCGGNCPKDEDHACDGYLGDIDNLYTKEKQ
jgi:hypothetical protein